jgi:hypothetical protein
MTSDSCLYFLDPDAIVPPSSTGGSPLADPRSRANSVTQIAPSALNLEAPVATHPARTQPRLPLADVAAIRRLSNRVNVLPVVARADTLTDARLSAVKLAVRRDLADAGIGFGIFDHDGAGPPDDARRRARSPSASATQPPYALISPEAYAHSDGTYRTPPARHELVAQYAYGVNPPSRLLARGRHTRTFRWGTLDVLDPRHCDFMALRTAVFHHMEVNSFLLSSEKHAGRSAPAADADQLYPRLPVHPLQGRDPAGCALARAPAPRAAEHVAAAPAAAAPRSVRAPQPHAVSAGAHDPLGAGRADAPRPGSGRADGADGPRARRVLREQRLAHARQEDHRRVQLLSVYASPLRAARPRLTRAPAQPGSSSATAAGPHAASARSATSRATTSRTSSAAARASTRSARTRRTTASPTATRTRTATWTSTRPSPSTRRRKRT